MYASDEKPSASLPYPVNLCVKYKTECAPVLFELLFVYLCFIYWLFVQGNVLIYSKNKYSLLLQCHPPLPRVPLTSL